jgi:phospholipase C
VENPSPSWNESHVDWSIYHPTADPPVLDGFVWEAAGDAQVDGFHDTLGQRAMGYYTDADLPYYYFLASQFATSDRWFSPVMSRTHPNRMYSMAATSQGHVYPIPQGGAQLTAPTIFGELQKAGISWKIYGGSGTYYSMFTESNSLLNGHFFPRSQYFTDLQNGTLPQVAWFEPGSDIGADEHPGIDPNNPGPNNQFGAEWVSTLINALMQSSSWKDSVFIFTFDEMGGFYDHVAPFGEVSPDGIKPNDLVGNDICNQGEANPVNCDFTVSGYRVPFFVVSPFARPHYVSHTNMDYTAALKLIETRFNLPSLTARDAAQPDMTEFFDFAGAPWATPPTPPQQPVRGGPTACYTNTLP